MPTAPVPRTGLGTVQRRMADPSKEEESGHSFSVPPVHDTKPRTTQRATRDLKTTRCLYFRPAQDRCLWLSTQECGGQQRPTVDSIIIAGPQERRQSQCLLWSHPLCSVRWLARLPLKSFAKLLQPCSPESARLNTFRRALYWVICDSLSERAGP